MAYADMFLLMPALGGTRVIPFFEDAMLDYGIMLGVRVLSGGWARIATMPSPLK